MNVLVVAEEAAGAHTLRLLSRTGHRIVAVLTSSPGKVNGSGAVAAEAKRLNLPTRPSESVKDPSLADEIRKLDVELLINVHSLYVIHEAILNAPAIGCLNLHPGPLPQYAGLDAPSWAIYRGESEHAVTLHWMRPGIDTGEIAYEARFPIEESDSGLSLSLKCVRAGLPLIARLLEDASSGIGVPQIPQDLSKRRYYRRKPPQGGRLDWSRPAREVLDFIRACDYAPFPSPWGHPLTRCGDRDVGVAKATIGDGPCDAPPGTIAVVEDAVARVAAADGWVMVTRVHSGGRYVPAPEVLRPGQRLGRTSSTAGESGTRTPPAIELGRDLA